MSNPYRIVCGDVLKAVNGLGPFDAVLSDPPYGIGFMGKEWDAGVPGREFWEAIRAELRPGAHLMSFGGTRTSHRLTCAIEDAGFEIRDSIAWLYGTGFPKSRNVGKRVDGFEGYGTALKPAHEPVTVARNPFSGTVDANAREHGTGALNVDGARIAATDAQYAQKCASVVGLDSNRNGATYGEWKGRRTNSQHDAGRWPANVTLDEHVSEALDANDIGGSSRFFYCAKPSKSEREAGLHHRAAETVSDGREVVNHTAYQRGKTERLNIHPTVKPIALARWLATLMLPPDIGRPRRMLIPFSGVGSEIIGALQAGWDEVVGIEISPEYADISQDRVDHWHRRSA